MSTQTFQRTIANLKRELANLEKQASDAAKKEVARVKHLHQIERSINKNTPLSLFRSKQQQIIQLSENRAQIQSEKAKISQKIADKTSQLHNAERNLLKDQERERNKIEQAFRRQKREQLEHQRALTRELEKQQKLTAMPLPPYWSLANDAPPKPVTYDVFISHASEDKNEFVRPLAQKLEGLGFEVWYDEFELKVGEGWSSGDFNR